jgi:hypothetical protein
MKNETKKETKGNTMKLTQEIKEQYKMHLYGIIEKYRYEKTHTQFEISVDTFEDYDGIYYGWDYEDALGEIFDEILEEKEIENETATEVIEHSATWLSVTFASCAERMIEEGVCRSKVDDLWSDIINGIGVLNWGLKPKSLPSTDVTKCMSLLTEKLKGMREHIDTYVGEVA